MQEVGGSIPPGSTSLRRFAATAGKPTVETLKVGHPRHREAAKAARHSPLGEGGLPIGRTLKYVYLLESIGHSEQRYVGLTDDLPARIAAHNAGQSPHTAKFKPWRLVTYVGFSDEAKAVAFEQYLKTASGRAFANKRLR